jgi:hypothetical protein
LEDSKWFSTPRKIKLQLTGAFFGITHLRLSVSLSGKSCPLVNIQKKYGKSTFLMGKSTISIIYDHFQ